MIDSPTIEETYDTIREFITKHLKWYVIQYDQTMIITVGIEKGKLMRLLKDSEEKKCDSEELRQVIGHMGREYPMIEMVELNLNITHRGKSFSIDLKNPNAINIISAMIAHINSFYFLHSASPLLDLMHLQLSDSLQH